MKLEFLVDWNNHVHLNAFFSTVFRKHTCFFSCVSTNTSTLIKELFWLFDKTYVLKLANSCLRPLRMSLILQMYNPGLSDEDRNTSTSDRLITLFDTWAVVLRATALEIAKGKKHIENSKKIYSKVATDFLYFSKSIADWPKFWDVPLAWIWSWWRRIIW